MTDRSVARVRSAAAPHELTRGAMPSVIYAPGDGRHGNFIEASYRRILADPAWSQRLEKSHTAGRQAGPTGPDEEVRRWRELDTATSSDALLMNIFCYPRVLAGKRFTSLLGLAEGLRPEFGYRPRTQLERQLTDRTEIDMRLGNLLVEAKLTESDCQTAPLRLIERYPRFAEVFEREALEVRGGRVQAYQLIRGVLAAEAEAAGFCLMCDARRPDLIESWYGVMRAVRGYELRARLRLVTWQEIAACVPVPLRTFLADKYGIESPV
ncbi:PGN_0703 family putative restriction endonuclease [Granulicella rosea]|uniref:PGN_0703 family putative restriction endonuclease n=1 Tax=Granulicella rosea TaxID=474952 RepID=UPI000B78ADFC|nr:hypothetical protein [Granulicella rosea]